MTHLARSLWLNDDLSKRWFVIGFTTYYDASGHQDDTSAAITVLGVAARVSRWQRFEREWNTLLGDFKVSHLHMTDYVHSRGPFKTWKGQEQKRADFLDRVIRVTARAMNKVFACGVWMKDFHAVNADYRLAEVYGEGRPDAGAYAFCAVTCEGLVTKWMREKKPTHAMSHVFEAGDRGRGAYEAFVKHNAAGAPPTAVSFVPKRDPQTGIWMRPFEPVDFLAWEYRNQLKVLGERELLPDRRSLQAIELMLPSTTGVHNEHTLRAMCVSNPLLIPRRT